MIERDNKYIFNVGAAVAGTVMNNFICYHYFNSDVLRACFTPKFVTHAFTDIFSFNLQKLPEVVNN